MVRRSRLADKQVGGNHSERSDDGPVRDDPKIRWPHTRRIIGYLPNWHWVTAHLPCAKSEAQRSLRRRDPIIEPFMVVKREKFRY